MPFTEVNTLVPRPTQVELAARLGISPAMVVKLKKQGMPVDSVAAADAWRKANVRTRTMSLGSTVLPMPSSKPSVLPPADPPPTAGQPVEDLWASRARKEAAEAAMAELRLEEQRKRLVDRAAVEAAHSRIVVQAREAALQIAARLAPLLGETAEQQRRAQQLLDAEMRRFLTALAGGADGA